MAGPCDHGGIHIELPPGGDTPRDVLALIRAILRGDDEGQAAILANADLSSVVHMLAALTAAWLSAAARGETDPDAPPRALTEQELQAAEAILITMIEGPGPGTEGW